VNHDIWPFVVLALLVFILGLILRHFVFYWQ
jgi:hypothetical protein